MRTHNIPSSYRKSKIYPYYASGPGAMIYTHELELPLSRAYFHMVPKVFEPLLYTYLRITKWPYYYIYIGDECGEKNEYMYKI